MLQFLCRFAFLSTGQTLRSFVDRVSDLNIHVEKAEKTFVYTFRRHLKRGFSRSLFRTSSSDTDCILTFTLGLSVPTLRRFCRLRPTIWTYDMMWYMMYDTCPRWCLRLVFTVVYRGTSTNTWSCCSVLISFQTHCHSGSISETAKYRIPSDGCQVWSQM